MVSVVKQPGHRPFALSRIRFRPWSKSLFALGQKPFRHWSKPSTKGEKVKSGSNSSKCLCICLLIIIVSSLFSLKHVTDVKPEAQSTIFAKM